MYQIQKITKKVKIYSICVFLLVFQALPATEYQPEFSVAGFYSLENSGRELYNFNVGWRFSLGDFADASKYEFDDSSWEVVSSPHTLKLIPAEGSGGRNYQGVAWYRKSFRVDAALEGKLLNIYFEAVMGKTAVYLNGQKVLEHFGGYLPFSVELTQHGVKAGDECILAVRTDNSDDRNYPPGKRQATLDFAYHGGIYRDVWMIATSPLHITDPNATNRTAGGGVFIQFGEISNKRAEITIKTEVKNGFPTQQQIIVENKLIDADGKTLRTAQSNVRLKAGETQQIIQKIIVDNPNFWHPDEPYLYRMATSLSQKSNILDGGIVRVGIRKIEWKGADGLWLNGAPADKLIGANRHQDYAYVGNAVPNSQHWRDAKKLREAGCRVIRVAHYPQDPSFMDACDELGMFVIVATPGWQFWNGDPVFVERLYSDVRNMIRRDRNHPSILMWEPVLNETRHPREVALRLQRIVHEEHPGYASAGDARFAGNFTEGIVDSFETLYGWTTDIGVVKQPVFCREFGENVDDWYAHNTNNRVSRSWGENALLIQALQLAEAYNEMYHESRQFVGGALWHPFDHQRGYHPDPYWGGLMDAFRQPKYSWYFFKSQIDAHLRHPLIKTGPMIFIAHELSPFSSPDVTIFTNCDELRLIVYERDTLVQKVPKSEWQLPHPPVTFKNVFDFNTMRIIPYREKNWQQVSFVVEGLIDGEVVCTVRKMPARRSNKLRLTIDNAGQRLIADGSDFIPVICEVVDDDGNVRRLAKDQILFSVEGEGEIIGDAIIGANPRTVEFGSAPLLVRSTLNAGKITVHARVLFDGENATTPTSIEFESIPPPHKLLHKEIPRRFNEMIRPETFERKLLEEERRRMLIEFELQQTDFGK